MTDVHDLLARALGGVAPSPDALQATIQRIRRRQRRRRVLVACVTLAVFAGAGVVVTRVADDGGDPLSPPAPPTATPPPGRRVVHRPTQPGGLCAQDHPGGEPHRAAGDLPRRLDRRAGLSDRPWPGWHGRAAGRVVSAGSGSWAPV